MKTPPHRFALALCAALAGAPCAFAQSADEVTVNPNAAGRVLLYPGGKFGRVEHPLLQPGEADPNAPIVLHMPRKHPRHRVAQAKAKPAPTVAAAAAAPAPAPAPKKQAAAETPSVPLSALPDESATKLVTALPPKAPARPAPQRPAATAQAAPKPAAKPPAKTASAAPKPPPPKSDSDDFSVATRDFSDSEAPATAPPPPQTQTRTARVEPNAADPAKRNSILFAAGAEEPPPSALDSVRGMIASLTAALWSGNAQIEINAFGGKANDKSSDARRLSLKRALIVRQLLIDDGIPAEKIVVHALGGASEGAPDRVDIFVSG
ncbi:MAG: hypothetical protein JO261_03865 [Alphaproteobacteria bacterium]|nr:hypothetical protein [Alphaproteobacteria bacterium]MBV9692817.1 hypothetical protein [Alphaproteobacteria bacterium]